uniref:SRCR domain-containing protein n=1 Tax=Macrostomum lignano TaxID=282301 RepID=A0A1I8FEN3_9PLAT
RVRGPCSRTLIPGWHQQGEQHSRTTWRQQFDSHSTALHGAASLITTLTVAGLLWYWSQLRAIAMRGAKVYLGLGRCPQFRNRGSNKIRTELPSASVEVWQVELASLPLSVLSFCRRYMASGYPLHALILKCRRVRPAHTITEDGIELQFQEQGGGTPQCLPPSTPPSSNTAAATSTTARPCETSASWRDPQLGRQAVAHKRQPSAPLRVQVAGRGSARCRRCALSLDECALVNLSRDSTLVAMRLAILFAVFLCATWNSDTAATVRVSPAGLARLCLRDEFLINASSVRVANDATCGLACIERGPRLRKLDWVFVRHRAGLPRDGCVRMALATAGWALVYKLLDVADWNEGLARCESMTNHGLTKFADGNNAAEVTHLHWIKANVNIRSVVLCRRIPTGRVHLGPWFWRGCNSSIPARRSGATGSPTKASAPTGS